MSKSVKSFTRVSKFFDRRIKQFFNFQSSLFNNSSGFSVAAVVIILVLFVTLAAFMVSVISTTTAGSGHELASSQALYIAEGGLDMAIRWLEDNDDYGQNITAPDSSTFDTASIDRSYANGTYSLTSSYCVTALNASLSAGATTAVVYSTAGFPSSGRIKINQEEIDYLSTNATSFLNLTRGVHGTSDTGHGNGTTVYPATILNGAINDTVTTIAVGTTTKFLSSGTIQIGTERIDYSAKTGTSFLYCVRGSHGTTAASHSSGDTVWPGREQCMIEVTATTGTSGTLNYGERTVRVTVRK